MASVHRPPTSTMIKKLALVVCCLALAATAAHAQDGSGSGIAGVTGLPPTLAPSPSTTTKAPTTKKPVVTETPTPSETTAAPTETPAPTTDKTTVAPTPTPELELEATTEAPTETPEPTTKAPKAKKTANATEVAEIVAPQTSLESAVAETVAETETETAAPASESSASSTATKSPSSGGNYGTKDSSSSGSGNEAATKAEGGGTKEAMTFVAVAVGVLCVVLVAALSVFTVQKRRAREAEEEEEDQKYVPSRHNSSKRPDLEMPPATTTAAVPVAYDNYATPQHAMMGNQYPDIRDEKAAAMGGQWKQPTVNAYRDSEEMFDAPLSKPVAKKNEWSGNYTAAAAAVVGTGAVVGAAATLEFNGDDDYTQPMQPRITKFRGKSEESTMDDEDYSQYSNNLMDSSANNKLNMSASEVDLDSLHEVKPTAATTATTTQEFEFDQYFNAPAAPAATQENDVDDVDVDDVDVDVDVDYEDIDVDIDDDNGARYSEASSVGEFHDSTVDRPSELDVEEFEV